MIKSPLYGIFRGENQENFLCWSKHNGALEMKFPKIVIAPLLLVLALTCCRRDALKLYPDIELHPQAKIRSLSKKDTFENLMFEIWSSGFFRKNDLTKEEIQNNTYGVFRKPVKSGPALEGRAYYQQIEGARDRLILNAKLFGHFKMETNPAPWSGVIHEPLDRRIRVTIVHELFHDFWYNILDERKRYLFSDEAEIFFIELMMVKTEEDKSQFINNSGLGQRGEVYFEHLKRLLEAREMYSHDKVFGTELYSIIAERAYSGAIIIPKQFRKYYLGILSDETLDKNRN